jgi:hypothetical protein
MRIPEIEHAHQKLNYEKKGIIVYLSVAENVQERAICIQPLLFRIFAMIHTWLEQDGIELSRNQQ